MMRVISYEINSRICSSNCPAPEPEPETLPDPPNVAIILKIDHINHQNIHIYTSRSLILYKLLGIITTFLDSSTDHLLPVVRAHTTFHIYPYFPQGPLRILQVTSLSIHTTLKKRRLLAVNLFPSIS